MRPAVLALCALAACGGESFPVGPDLPRAANVTIVAHQDDDLILMQPDVTDVVEARAGLINVYITAGNGTHQAIGPNPDNPSREGDRDPEDGIIVADYRYEGLMAAYAQAAGLANAWTCGWIDVAGHPAQHCRLDEAGVSLLFLAYPDGGKEGQYPNSLLQLWQGSIAGADSVSLQPSRYDQAGLIAALAEVIETAQPTTIRTLEVAATHGRDHVDHMIAGALALLAQAEARSQAELISFRGYSTEEEPPTMIDGLYARSENLVAHYEACATGCNECGLACAAITKPHATWLHRRYAIGFRAHAAGALRTADGTGCAGLTADGAPSIGPCDAQPARWELADGVLRTSGRCLAARDTGELVTTADCTPDPQHRVFLDDEGHLWLGQPPPAGPDMAYAHLLCIGVDGGRPDAVLCGDGHAPRWELSEPAVTAPRPLPAAPGRAVRIADLTGDGKGDLCAVDAGTLRCALGAGDGTFGAPVDIAALAVEPESLVAGDIDGDQRADACGRDASGIHCALSSMGMAVQLWTPSFARTGPADATDRSLQIDDASRAICGLAEQGVVCATRGLSAVSDVRSRWPARDAPLWSGDLDGDRHVDWCVASDDGPACGLARDRDLTTDGAPWGFALAGVRDGAPASAAVGALADVDGDGRADLCTVTGRAIVCQYSTGNGFAPAVPFATLPPGGPLTALWLGDLDGDGTADACVEDGAAVTCVRAR